MVGEGERGSDWLYFIKNKYRIQTNEYARKNKIKTKEDELKAVKITAFK